MSNQYSLSRLRRFCDERDAARAKLEVITSNLRHASEALELASRRLDEFNSSRIDVRTDADVAIHERHRERLLADVEAASRDYDEIKNNRSVAASEASVAAALAKSGIEFWQSRGIALPADILVRA